MIAARHAPNALYGGFSTLHVVIRNLDVRTYDNPSILPGLAGMRDANSKNPAENESGPTDHPRGKTQ